MILQAWRSSGVTGSRGHFSLTTTIGPRRNESWRRIRTIQEAILEICRDYCHIAASGWTIGRGVAATKTLIYTAVDPAATGSAMPVTNRASSLESHMKAAVTSAGERISPKSESG